MAQRIRDRGERPGRVVAESRRVAVGRFGRRQQIIAPSVGPGLRPGRYVIRRPVATCA